MATVRASRPLGAVWPPWGRGPSPGSRMAAVWAWPVSYAPYRRRGGVARPQRIVFFPLGRSLLPGPRMAAVGA